MSLQVKLLFGTLFLVNVAFFFNWFRSRKNYLGRKRPLLREYPVGFVVAFFDTLGIGSFAPTTAVLKLQGKLADELIPGTLNIGLNTAALLEMIIMVTAIVIDPVLLMATGIVRPRPRCLDRGWSREPPAAAGHTISHGSCSADCGLRVHGDEPSLASGRRRRVHPDGLAIRGRGRGELCARCIDEHWHWPVRALHDCSNASGTAPAGIVSDHDGGLRTRAAGGRSPIFSFRSLRIWNLNCVDAGLDTGSAPRSVCRQTVAAFGVALAGRGSGYLRLLDDAAILLGQARRPTARINGGSRQSLRTALPIAPHMCISFQSAGSKVQCLSLGNCPSIRSSCFREEATL